ncbi:hypothetical protein N7495_008263 [Penicillium taxi]|uniref:uncharacterized protein n=1 Tax=Penicillium taxi TaxID=168475 RepID=UPI002545560D|nr:uncharacterized protein N7495_008263 [Penicillium taxi]KAJ5888222.1 hypothetical protein N7495_008263 [Penicillium taxi]
MPGLPVTNSSCCTPIRPKEESAESGWPRPAAPMRHLGRSARASGLLQNPVTRRTLTPCEDDNPSYPMPAVLMITRLFRNNVAGPTYLGRYLRIYGVEQGIPSKVASMMDMVIQPHLINHSTL